MNMTALRILYLYYFYFSVLSIVPNILVIAASSNKDKTLSFNPPSDPTDDSSIKNEAQRQFAFPVNLDSIEEIVNNERLTFKNRPSITIEEFQGLSRKAIDLPSFLDPFCKSILEEFRDKGKTGLTLAFYNFLFNGFVHVFKDFDPEAPHSWDFFINLAFVQFLNSPESHQCECEIIINIIVIPSYQMLANYNFNFDYERFNYHQNPMADDFSVSAYLEEVVLEALIDRFKQLFNYKNDVDAQVHFKILLWEVAKDIPIRSKKFNYHCAFLTNTPFKYIPHWNFNYHNSYTYINQVEPFLESLASSIYIELKKSSLNELQDILLNVFASVSKADVNYSDTIEILQKENNSSPENLISNPFLWNPNDFSSFLTVVMSNNSYIIGSLSSIERSLLEFLQNNPTHTFTYFLLQNFYASDASCLTFVRSLLFSAFNVYYELSNGSIGSDLSAISDFLLPMFDAQTLSQKMFLDMVDWNHLASISAILNQNRRLDCSYLANKALQNASFNGRVKIVKWLLEQKKYIISIDSLNYSFTSRYIEIVKIVLELRGSDIQEESVNKALKNAIQNGNLKIVKLLLELRGSDIQEKSVNTAVECASIMYHVEIVKLLFELRGSDIQKESVNEALENASEYGCVEIVKLLFELRGSDIQEKSVNRALESASKHRNRNNVEIVKLLFELRGSDIQEESVNKALEYAFKNGNFKIVQLLLESRGSDIQEKSVNTAVEYASRFGHVEIVKILLELRGSDIQEKSVNTAVECASRFGHVEIVKLLLELRGPNIQKKSVNTAVEYASQFGHLEVFKLLLESRGSDITKISVYRMLEFASKYGVVEIVEFLLELKEKLKFST